MIKIISQVTTQATAILVACFMLISQTVFAEPENEIEKVRAELVKMMPGAASAEIVETPVAGVYRVEVQGKYAYTHISGDHILLGDLYNTVEQVNLGEKASSARMAVLIDGVPVSKMIVFSPKEKKRHITVFTDLDCGYCRKLHKEVSELNDAGIEVRYLAFPRAGIGSDSHKKFVSVWCNDDQQVALTAAKLGQSVASATCDNPIEENYNLGLQVGVRGTPTIIFDDGTVTPGYIPAARLIEQLGLGKHS